MSSDVDKLCRAIYFNVLKAKDLKEVVEAVEAIVGSENVALVKEIIAQNKKL